jgi:hypothetical protein
VAILTAIILASLVVASMLHMMVVTVYMLVVVDVDVVVCGVKGAP